MGKIIMGLFTILEPPEITYEQHDLKVAKTINNQLFAKNLHSQLQSTARRTANKFKAPDWRINKLKYKLQIGFLSTTKCTSLRHYLYEYIRVNANNFLTVTFKF